MLVEISIAELIDKITILEIKSERISDVSKLKNVQREFEVLRKAYVETVGKQAPADALYRELKSVNESIWDLEDAIRKHEAADDFGEDFIAVARQIYTRNDQRASIKKRINELFNSELVEEKSYESLG